MWPSVASGSLYGSRTHAVKGYDTFLPSASRIFGKHFGELLE
jgi:hypothetical protein